MKHSFQFLSIFAYRMTRSHTSIIIAFVVLIYIRLPWRRHHDVSEEFRAATKHPNS